MRRLNLTLCPTAAQTAWKATEAVSTKVCSVRCELITPMYGGGVKAGEVDCKMPIRASALRGQLRFWWRLLYGASLSSEELFQVEYDLWGGISNERAKASQVTLKVNADQVCSKDLIPSRNRNRIRSEFDYVLILGGEENPKLLKQGYQFELVLTFSSAVTEAQQAEVIEALRWWASFGGVGARTRRGLGAIKATSNNPTLNPVGEQEVQDKGGRMVLNQPASNASQAWRDAVEALKGFRQGSGIGRNRGPGRSYWPEPDAIRRLDESLSPHHPPQCPVDGYYPRAAFGLPIVFHFKDKDDPQGYTLEPDKDDSDRMASPLILRPYFDGTQYRSLAMLLPGWEKCVSVPVRFNSKPESQREAWPKDRAERKSLAEKIQPLKDRDTDALSAFMYYFKSL